MKSRCFFVIISVLFFLASSFCLSAEEELPEKGFRITKDTVLNVGVAVEPEYESNITKASKDTVVTDTRENDGKAQHTDIVYDMILHYSPSLRIKLDDSKKTIGFSMLFDYNHYLGLDKSETSKQLSELEIKSEFLGEFNKDGFVIFDFKNSLLRTAVSDSQDLPGKHKNLFDAFGVGLAFKNAEDTLLGKIKLGIDVNYLEQSQKDSAYKDYNYFSPSTGFFGRWKFLPKTMAFFSLSARYRDYYESRIRNASRSIPINTFVGVMGQVSQYFSSKISIGYSVNIGHVVKHDYNANAEMVFKYNDLGAVLGYFRNMQPSAYYSYISSHELYFKFKQKFAKYFLAAVSLKYYYIAFGKNMLYDELDEYERLSDGSYQMVVEDETAETVYTTVLPKGNRKDHLLFFIPSFSYAILSWLGLRLSYTLEYRDTGYFKKSITQYTHNTDSGKNFTRTTDTHYDYMDHRVMLSIVLDY